MLDGTLSKRENLSDWLSYIEQLHSEEIEFGLTRVSQVYNELFPDGLNCRVITVGGTNGKGSSCALIERALLDAGYSCGKNTSPHIIKFNERIVVNNDFVTNDEIIYAFEKVDFKRQKILLTYFEFTFLAALVVFQKHEVDFAICEVGMGGRLDAVNILSPEISIITNIGLDHTQWLGNTREEIALEKVAISRPYLPCIVGDIDFPAKAIDYLNEMKVEYLIHSREFYIEHNKDQLWQLIVNDFDQYFPHRDESLLKNLPKLDAVHHYQNASCAILALLSLRNVEINSDNITQALTKSEINGRCQVLSQSPLVIVDAAHNIDSVKALDQFVKLKKSEISNRGKTIAVVSMLDDKNINASLRQIGKQIDEWYIAELPIARGASFEKIKSAILAIQESSKQDSIVREFDSIKNAFKFAKKYVEYSDCVLVFGSFFVVSDILRIN